jgi:predicted RNA-binding Zn ribbon-like protein
MSDKPPAPHELDVVIDFVNTADLETGEEALSDPAALAGWLAGRVLLPAGAKLTRADLDSALELREALRQIMLEHNGGSAEVAAVAILESAARQGELSVHFDSSAARVAPRAEGAAGALAALLVPVAAAMGDGSWQRVKACRADDCHWAFYDFSRNRSGTWCDMAVCGNREKVRCYRGRAPRVAGRKST